MVVIVVMGGGGLWNDENHAEDECVLVDEEWGGEECVDHDGTPDESSDGTQPVGGDPEDNEGESDATADVVVPHPVDNNEGNDTKEDKTARVMAAIALNVAVKEQLSRGQTDAVVGAMQQFASVVAAQGLDVHGQERLRKKLSSTYMLQKTLGVVRCGATALPTSVVNAVCPSCHSLHPLSDTRSWCQENDAAKVCKLMREPGGKCRF